MMLESVLPSVDFSSAVVQAEVVLRMGRRKEGGLCV